MVAATGGLCMSSGGLVESYVEEEKNEEAEKGEHRLELI